MNRKNKRILQFGILLIILMVLAALISASVFAAYLKRSEDVINTFKPAVSIIPDIEETFDGSLKKDVSFKVGDTDYPVYVRAKIIITWQDKDGIVYFSQPNLGTDYTISLNLTDWVLQEDGFYYYKSSVASGGQTTNLINQCKQISSAPVDGYTLSVEILVQTIQAIGLTDGENGAEEIPAWEDAGWDLLD